MLEIARIAEKHDLIVISDEIYDRRWSMADTNM